MALTPGSRIGVYEIVALVGHGGMGEVYRARDTRLDRSVALKTLPGDLAADPDRLARFEREAKTLAQLNHPHIASIHGLEIVPAADSAQPAALALAMEMVEGDTLADRLAAGPLPLDDALVVARQIAEALEHAHAAGIVHRDLKPANVKLGPRDGAINVKVLDFGLAKAFGPGDGGRDSGSGRALVSSPTITSPAHMTRAGIILGTAAYMAPEQARGRAVDQRADIWAFGCVLYEMLTARRPFDGEEIADVLARVIQSEPDWSALPPGTPRALVSLLQRCLRKDAAKRMHSIADVRIELEDLGSAAPDVPAAAPGASAAAPRRWTTGLAGAMAGALVAMLATSLLERAPGPAPNAPVLRYSIPMPEGWTLYSNQSTGRLAFAISPDGEKLLVVLTRNGVRRIFTRRLDGTAFRELAGTDGASSVYWAPDSQRFGLVVGNEARRSDLTGAVSQPMVAFSTGAAPTIAVWGEDDQIIATVGPGIPLIAWPAGGGVPREITALSEDARVQRLGAWLPDGHGLLFAEGMGGRRSVVLAQRLGEAPVPIVEVQSNAVVAPSYGSGRLLMTLTEPSGRTVLTAQPFDPATRTTDTATILVADLNPAFSVSDTGVLAFGPAGAIDQHFVWLDKNGVEVSKRSPALRPFNFDLSPDEQYVVVQPAGGGLQLHDLSRGVTTQIADRGNDPLWSPDGRRLAVSITGGSDMGIHAVPAFGGPMTLLRATKDPTYLDDWSRDGKWLAGHVNVGGHGVLIPLQPDAPLVEFEQQSGSSVDETRFSPDGRWLAYGLNGGGAGDVYLMPVPPTGERWKISPDGGGQPRWRGDGKALSYLSLAGMMMQVDLDLQPGAPPRIGAPRTLFDAEISVALGVDQFAISRDGTRFLVRRPDQAAVAAQSQLHIIVNWPALLSRGDAASPEQ